METTNATCWIIADAGWDRAIPPAQFAALRGMSVRLWSGSDSFPPKALAGKGTMMALTATALRYCSGSSLRACVEAGAIVHVSHFEESGDYSLQPFVNSSFAVKSNQRAHGYAFSDAPMLPHALRNERLSSIFKASVAEGLNGHCSVLGSVESEGNVSAPALFSLRVGAGTVIYDLNSQSESVHDPIIRRLATADGIVANCGALVAANMAAGYGSCEPSKFNITIDDRPANFDYLGAARVERLMAHMDARCPGVHVDFAWTPAQVYASRRYVEAVRRYDGGFVWHGFHRHVDHRELCDPAAELRQGERFINILSRRHGVRFQRMMVFPYERTTEGLLRYVQAAGFAGSAECADSRPEGETRLPEFMRYSTATHHIPEIETPVLRRYRVSTLDRPAMLALAALGYPIIAMAHPGNVSLRRFTGVHGGNGSRAYFDRVLDFAAEKSLQPASLETIATDLS
jgi:hypothetical protein